MTPTDVARVCHTVLREHSNMMGDNTQPEWKDISEEQKNITIHNVQYVIDNPNDKPHLIHENWLREKAAQGWSFGYTRDPNLKQDPRFTTWPELSFDFKIKDHLFHAMVHALTDEDLGEVKDETPPEQKTPSPDEPVRRVVKKKEEKKES